MEGTILRESPSNGGKQVPPERRTRKGQEQEKKPKDMDGQLRSKKALGALIASREHFTDGNRNNRGSCKIAMYLSCEPQVKISWLESRIDDRPS